MNRLILVALCAFALLSSASAGNNYPFVLVHGLMGWGRDEMFGVKYWGGIFGDLQEELENEGHVVYTASVGPLSSNWDRACELYAQIKGGRVDYGEEHSTKFGHSRYGRTYPGFYPQWGEKDSNGNVNKIHLVGHSLGGQTIRILAQLLASGSKGSPVDEIRSIELFEGGHSDWIHSLTAISSPIEGSGIGDALAAFGDNLEALVATIVGFMGVFGDLGTLAYDFDLDQWGIGPRQNGEEFKDYVTRVLKSNLFSPGFQDVSLYDAGIAGSAENNKWIKTQPDIYHYSYATIDTYSWRDLLLRKIQLPNPLMFTALQVTSTYLGSYAATTSKGLGLEWQKNDGVVNSVSMRGAFEDTIVSYTGESVPGRWHYMPALNKIDHLSIVGFTVLENPFSVYKNHFNILANLPAGSSSRKLEEMTVQDTKGYQQLKESIEKYSVASEELNDIEKLKSLCASSSKDLVKAYCEQQLKTQGKRLRH